MTPTPAAAYTDQRGPTQDQVNLLAVELFAAFRSDHAPKPAWMEWGQISPIAQGNWRRVARASYKFFKGAA